MSNLTFNGARKTFGSTIALEGLDLEVAPGELISLLGPSGCGKTTALRIAAGFERPDSGGVELAGRDITGLPAHKRNMGMVFQSYSLFPNLSCSENVEFGLRTRKLGKPERTSRVNEMLELVELGHLADRYPHQMSGGQQQRVALARALAVRPEVLLLDEPLSALDAKVRTTLRDEIRRIQTTLGITTVLVTHDQEEALGVSDRIGVMSQGRLEQLGTPTEIYHRPVNAFVARFVGSMNELPAIVVDSRCVQIGNVAVALGHAHDRPTGESVSLLVRPENVSLADGSGSAPATMAGTVVSRTFQGSATVLAIRLDLIDKLINVDLPRSGAGDLAPGDRASVRLDGSRAIVEAVTAA